MFLNALDVRDSTTDDTFVGSSCDVLLEQKRRINNNNGSDSGDDIVTVWCCVMTFYRVAVFSYQATSDGQVLLPSTSDDNVNDNHGEDNQSSKAANKIRQLQQEDAQAMHQIKT